MTQGVTLGALAASLATGEITARDLIERALARYDETGSAAKTAFVALDRDAARDGADASDERRAAGRTRSAWDGIPVSIKDLFDVAGETTHAASITFERKAAHDAVSVARLRDAGLIPFGRTNMTEFAFSGLGLNPHTGTPLTQWRAQESRIAGGSSSGAAASIALDIVPAAIGSDTGGSVRIPAAFNRLVGYKPTASRIPLEGAVPLSPSLDSVGPLAHNVRDCDILAAIMAGVPAVEREATRSARLAVPKTLIRDGIDAAVATAFEAALSRLAANRFEIVPIALDELSRLATINAKGGFATFEAYAWHRDLIATSQARYDPRVVSRILRGAEQSEADHAALLAARRDFIAAIDTSLAGFDFWLMPTVAIVPPRLSELEDDADYARINALVLRNPSIVNFLDGCAVTLPIEAADDAPVGLSMVGKNGSDDALLSLAMTIEKIVVPHTV